MPRTVSKVTFPCYSPFYQRRRGVTFSTAFIGHDNCLQLFSSKKEARDNWRGFYKNRIQAQQMQIATWRSVDELVDFFDEQWDNLLREYRLHFVLDAKGDKSDKADSIGRLFRKHDRARFEKRTAFKPKYNWDRPGRLARKFLPIGKAGRTFSTSTFAFVSDGGLLLPEGVKIGLDYQGRTVGYLGADGRVTKKFLPADRVSSWVGSFYLRLHRKMLDIIYESTLSGTWEFKYTLATRQWYERRFYESGTWHPAKNC